MTLLTKQQIEALLNRIAEIKADLDEFDGDTRGHKVALWNAQEELEDAAPDLASTALDALARLEDAEAAQALVLFADEGPDLGATSREPSLRSILFHHYVRWMLSDDAKARADNYIRALADPSGVEALAALRAREEKAEEERDALETAREMLGGFWAKAIAERDDALTRLAAAEGRVAALERIADEIDLQVQVTRKYAADSGMDAQQVRLMEICTSHFLDKARAIRAALATVTPPANDEGAST